MCTGDSHAFVDGFSIDQRLAQKLKKSESQFFIQMAPPVHRPQTIFVRRVERIFVRRVEVKAKAKANILFNEGVSKIFEGGQAPQNFGHSLIK